MQTRRLAVGAVQLEVAEAGLGSDRHLLLLHGFTGAKEDFSEFLDPLASEGWHAVVPDLRGHGGSDHPDDEAAYSLELFADDAWGLVDALGWDRLVLAGLSMGGMMAQVAALRRPERLDALVLMDTSHGPLEGMDTSELELGVSVVREHGMPTLMELMDARDDVLGTPAAERLRAERPGWDEYGRRKFLATSGAMWAAMAKEMVHQADRLEALSGLPSTLPVLVIVGEQDKPFVGACERIAKTIPGARLVVLPDAGHAPQFENTEAWWDALGAFLKEVQ